MVDQTVDADVVVVGGGIAGCVAAIHAARSGASVVVVDKARSLRRSGDAGTGAAFLTTYLDLGEQWDTPEAFADWYVRIADGLVDMRVAQQLAIDPLPAAREFLDEIGVSLADPAGDYHRMSRMWTPGPIVVKFEGTDIKPRLADAVARAGVRVVGGVHVTSVLTDADGRAAAVTGFDVRSAKLLVLHAKAVVLATGSAERVLFNSPRRDPFNTYHVPYHGATGFALAARAGASMANIEFLGTFLFPRGFASGAMGNLLEAGGRLINGNGELIADLPDADQRIGYGIVGKAAGEILAGRGPVYIDCTQLPSTVLDELPAYLSHDAPLFNEFLAQSGIDLARHPVEFELFNATWSATGSPKGVVVDGSAQTAVPGLFAAGDLATPVYALAGSLTSGLVAGAEAARFSATVGPPGVVADKLAAERERIFAPLGRPEGVGWREFERALQDTMTRYVGIDRNDNGLRQAGQYLSGYRAVAGEVSAANPHELMRAHEAFDLHLFDELMTAAALERDETRFNFVMGHRRSDHPCADDATWKAVAIVVAHDGERPVLRRTIPTPWWRERELSVPERLLVSEGKA